jgi:K+-sensing histidine kinase KdpD
MKKRIAIKATIKATTFPITSMRLEYIHPAAFSRNMLAGFLNDVSNENYHVEIDIDKKTEAVLLSGDPHLFQRAINNILYNSVQHNPDGCKIYFSLRQVDNNVAFIVSDNGKGTTSELFEKLQNRSHYLSCNNSILLQQHGLGLYIVQQIVKLHNGTVSFCTNISGGFQVTISIPTVEKE